MFRLTIYDDEKAVDEFEKDELRDAVESALRDLEIGSIRSFTASRISKKTYHHEKPFWED